MLNATVEEEIYVLEPVLEEEELPRARARLSWPKRIGLTLLGAMQIGAFAYGIGRLLKRLRA